MPYATNRDRDPRLLEKEQVTKPAPPLNVFARSGYQPGVFNLEWEDPSKLSVNSRFSILGVNVYRSFDSEYGPFTRVTETPIGGGFWRDQTNNELVVNEPVDDSQWILRGVETAEYRGRRFVFKTLRSPIVKEGSQNVPADRTMDVQVFIDGVEATVLRVDGNRGEIELDVARYPDVVTQRLITPVAPGEASVVTVTYRFNRVFIKTDLNQRIFYRFTTVGAPASTPPDCICQDDLVETLLGDAALTTPAEIEKLDYIWSEAVRRNRWILDQGGERVKVFLQKDAGQPCLCNVNNEGFKQPLNDCVLCYGTGILGGFEGPYDILIAPDDGERKIAQRDVGRLFEHQYEVWTTPSPLISMRDFIVKADGERYAVGAVRRPSNRGMILQQHFTIGHIDTADIRYSVPVDNPYRFTIDRVQPRVPDQNSGAVTTDKPNIPDEREIRGRTIAWENITF